VVSLDALWLVVRGEHSGARWIRLGDLESPVVLPEAATVRVRVTFASEPPSWLTVEYAPPQCPPMRQSFDVGESGPFDGRLENLPPGPLQIEVSGRKQRVELQAGETKLVTFHLGK
jgi:hypothetical protein